MAGLNTLTDNRTLALPVPGSVAIARYDLTYWDAATKRVRPLTSLPTLASEALDQVNAAGKFLGFAVDARLATEVDDGFNRVFGIEGVCDYDCQSQIFSFGDLVGPTWAGGAALVNQQVTRVTNIASAVGIVIASYQGVATSRVRFRLISRYAWDLGSTQRQAGPGGSQGGGARVLADAAYQVLVSDPPLLSMAPTSARNITLPPEGQAASFEYSFTNTGGATATFLGSAGGAVRGNGVVPAGKTCWLWCDGTFWNGLVSA